jgi:hypothetical protein
MANLTTEWVNPLKDPFWTSAAARYQKVRWITPQNRSLHWQAFASYAARYGLATDAVYLARVGWHQLEVARQSGNCARNRPFRARFTVHFRRV